MFSDPRAIASMAFDTKHHLPQVTSHSQSVNESRENFKVVIRVRPPLPREIPISSSFYSILSVSERRISVEDYQGSAISDLDRIQDIQKNPGIANYHHFTFDRVFEASSTQEEVYSSIARPAVLSTLQGYNATMIAYGQTSTGKTFTMEGFKYNSSDPERGIIPRASEEIFRSIEHSPNILFMVRASYLQIYNENISDLLKSDRRTLQIREDRRKGVFVDGLSEWAVRSCADICSLMQKGQSIRNTASTRINDISSRSHAVFIITIEQMARGRTDKSIRVGKLNFVDLAGSERVRMTGATGLRLEESKKINQSLSALGNVIAALTDHKTRTHIPYRDSKITRILEDSLGGNCKTTMLATVTPAFESVGETISTLKFAHRAKHIKNIPKVNEDLDQKTLIRRYEIELARLREELETKTKNMVDMQALITLEESKRQAEADREAAVAALEARSEEFLREQEEKRQLEEKIKLMDSQLLVGGTQLEETPQFIQALEEKQQMLKEEYEQKLQEMEKEIEESQTDKYKEILMRQRDIMIALTTRLNERDETIIQLQEELDAYDKLHREAEERLELKGKHCEGLEVLLKDNHIEVPDEVLIDSIRVNEFRKNRETESSVMNDENTSELSGFVQSFKTEQSDTDAKGGPEVLEFLEGLYFAVSDDAYSKEELMDEVQKLYEYLKKKGSESPSKSRYETRKTMTVEEMLQMKRGNRKN